MPIYTKTGDCGKTSLIGGKCISKSSLRLEAYGTLDELTAFEGDLYRHIKDDEKAGKYLLWIMDRTMDCAALLASDGPISKSLPQITEKSVQKVEEMIDSLLEGVPRIAKFTLPVGSAALCSSHICRTVCRRAERCIVRLQDDGEETDANVICFINRLSDFFYALGRYTVCREKAEEVYWEASRDNM